jgi:uncharacterized MAPEG superfamily protein
VSGIGKMPSSREENMTLEIKLLVWSAALAFIQMLVAVTGAFLQVGLPTLAGNRENMAPMPGWAGRAERAHFNMLENLLLFAILVLAAQFAGKLNTTTALGAQLFFWARVAYAVIYVAGWPWIRTAAWAVSVVGLLMIFFQLM